MLSAVIRRWALSIPDVRYIRAIPNRILKPLHRALGLGGGVVDVLGFLMELDPNECVDGILWFSPNRYDQKEINFLFKNLSPNGVFVDVGSNIGFWSLRVARVFHESTIISIEANPNTFKILSKNVKLNRFFNIIPVNVGVSDEVGELPLYLHDKNNRGGDSFASHAFARKCSVIVPVKPLYDVITELNLEKIDFMKIDIEGFEEKVLHQFFRTAPKKIWPKFICAEITHVPQVQKLLIDNGYQLEFSADHNSVFVNLVLPDTAAPESNY